MGDHRLAFLAPPVVACRALTASLLLSPLLAGAASDTTTFGVSATVVSTCAISATALAFGVYVLGQTDGTGTLSVTCTNGTAYTIALDAGTGAGATAASRKMTGPSSQVMNYSLYQDVGHTTVWGDSLGVSTKAGTGNGTLQSIPVYGRIPAAQAVGAGAYSDTITVTLTY